jgi:hypothetical protein
MNRIIPKINDKFKNYVVISEPYLINKIWYVDVMCSCGTVKKQPTGGLKKLTLCKKCNAKIKYRKYKSGDKKYNLTIIDYVNSSKDHTQIMVKCDCGIISNISTHHFGKIKTCRNCFSSKSGIEHPSYKGTKNITKTYFSQIKLNAKKRNLKFNLNIDMLDTLLIQQNHQCYISGQKINVHNHTASLDRIDSSKPYVKNNVAWLHKDIQRMKSDFPLDYFIQICNKITNNNTHNKIYKK